MNKHRYRIVFNRARGLLMAVAETAAACGKAAGPGATRPAPAGPTRGGAMAASVRTLIFGLWAALGLIAWPAAGAQIVADPGAPANQRPTVLNAANGVPLVNIQTPSAAGVSRNSYRQFDVQRQGAILNNSRTDAQTVLGGWVQGNPWLAGGTARVILNEVNSSNPSLLHGYVEVGGSRAQVVIANPAGVTCDGCGFINASRATLTTGSPIVENGNLDGYRVQGGTVAINGAGLDASGADYTDIIARAVQVNAGIWANQLKITAGANRVDAGNGQAAPIAGNGGAPGYGIDVAQLGGMYAGKITLVGTEAGVGVRNAGNIGASAGDVVVTADGRLENAGRITGASQARIDAESGIRNSGTVYAQGDADLSTRGDIDNSGLIAAQGNATLAATGADSRIASDGGSVLGAGVHADGTLGSGGDLALSATRAIVAQGQNLSGGDQSLSAESLDLAGSQTAGRNISLSAGSGDLDASGATLAAGQTLTARTGRTLRTDRAAISAAQIRVAAHDLSNVGGDILQTGSGDLTLDLPGGLDNTSGRIASAGAVSLSAAGLTNADGIIAASSLALDSRGQALDNGHGTLAASGAADGGGLDIQSGVLNNDGGLIQARGALTVDTHGQTLVNTESGDSGGVLAQGAVILTTGDLDNRAGYVGGGGALAVNGGAIDNSQGGVLAGASRLDLYGSALDNRGGQVQALGGVGVHLGDGVLNNGAGLVSSGATLTAAAGSIVNAGSQGSGQGLEGQSVSLTADRIDNRDGAVRADDSLILTSGGTIDNTRGLISALNGVTLQDADLTRKSLAVTNTDGTLIAGQRLDVDSASLTGDGKLLSQGDLAVKLTESYVHTGTLQANGNASLETAGTLVNQSTLQAGAALNLTAATLDNQADGRISAGQVHLQATDSHTLTNRGLIDGQDTIIETITLNNLGTGRIYGDHLAIGATTVTNAAENGVAPVMAARNRLDIGAETIDNQEHALIFSAGDMALGGGLDGNRQAIGQAAAVNNNSATIEALGNLDLAARQIANTNEHFSTTVQSLGTEHVVEYQGSGSPNRYKRGTPGVYTYDDESLHLHTPEGYFESWSRYSYDRTTTETKVQSSDPAQILSGGAMAVSADSLLNDKSRIIAGGALDGNIGTLTNTEVAGERTITDSGTVISYWRHHQKGRDSTGSSAAAYHPPATIQAIALTPTVYEQDTAHSGSGTRISALSTGSLAQSPSGADGGQSVSPITQVSLPAVIVRSGGINTAVPDNSLFRLNPAPHAGYLVETDPGFADYRSWLSSDYMLNALSLDPATTQERLGDGFYEQKLVREQVALLTGRRFLDGYASDEAEYRGLMDAGTTFAKAHQLVPGVALSAEQMAQLTSDIVWLVAKDVVLPDGNPSKVLVPQLYVRVKDGDLSASGALIGGDSVNLDLTGNLTNGGTIAGRHAVTLSAENLDNLGGRIRGNDVAVAARTDLANIGGRIEGVNSLAASAGRDLNVVSTRRTQSNAQGSRTNIDRVAGLYVTGSGGTLLAAAGRDVNLNAAAIANSGRGGSTTLAAGRDLNLGTVAESSDSHIVWDGKNWRNDSSRTEAGSTVQATGDIRLQAGNDLSARGADVTSDQGALLATAGRDVELTAGENMVDVDEAHQHKGRSSAFSSKTITTRDTLDQTTAQATTLSGDTTTVLAGRNIGLTGSNAVSSRGTTLSAQGDVNIAAAGETTAEGHFRDEKQSGLFSSGGIGFTLGTRQQSVDDQTTGTSAAASTVGSSQGDVAIDAGKDYRQVGSDVLAPQGNIAVAAQNVDITEAQNAYRNSSETRFSQSGLTVAVTNPVVTAVQTAQQMHQAAAQVSDARLKALAAATTALSANNAYDAVKAGQSGNLAAQAGGISVSITVGGSSSKSKQTQTGSTAQGSTVEAGGNVDLSATGAGKDSDLTLQGSTVQAGHDATLKAEGDINLLAAKNTSEQHSTNSSQSAGVGVAITYGSGGFAAGFTANASEARGKADGQDTRWTNTHAEAGNQLSLQSGGDTTLKGAVARGKRVQADVGADLNIESLQDTSAYKSQDQSFGGSVTIGYGFAASANASRQKVDSSYASVNEQSGIEAEDGGFQVDVKGNTDLKGAVIASADQAVRDGKNTLATATLTTSNIQNRAEASANSSGITLDSSMATQGKYGMAKAVIGNALNNAHESSSSSGQTLAAISGGVIRITNEAGQLERTGQTSAETLATLNRDTDNSHTKAHMQDVEAMRQTVEAERTIKVATFNEAVKFSDEAYRLSFLEKARMYKLERDPKKGTVVLDQDGKPVMKELSDAEKKALKPGTDGKLNVFTNGIFNDEAAAGRYAVQMSELPPGRDVYLVYYPEANNAISELMVAGYQKFMEGGIGDLANATQEVKDLMEQYGAEGLNLVGHSRGAMTIGNAMESLAGQSNSGGVLNDTEIKFVGPAYNAQKAATMLDAMSNGNHSVVLLQNHADDFVGGLIGGNPATYDQRPPDSDRLKEWWRIFGDAPTVHSCYGTMAVDPIGCKNNYGVPKTIDVQLQTIKPARVKP